MKKVLFLLTISFISLNLFAQKEKVDRDSLLMNLSTLVRLLDFRISDNNRYKLYPTENVYTFLKLDTKTGKIDQVQWSLDDNKEGTFHLNEVDLSYGSDLLKFELYPTQNMYQFILLEKTTGDMWHVQWGIGDSKRWIKKIY